MAVNRELRPLRNLVIAFGLFAACGFVILFASARQSPSLHTAFDGGIFVLSGVLALLMVDMGWRAGDQLARLLAVAFAITPALELIHVVAAIEFSTNPPQVQ